MQLNQTEMKQLVNRLMDYGFTCEAGTLEKCEDFIALKAAIDKSPEYTMGQRVSFHVSGIAEGVNVTSEATGWITAMRFGSSSTERFIEYGITDDLTDVYHYGKPAQWWRRGFMLFSKDASNDGRREMKCVTCDVLKNVNDFATPDTCTQCFNSGLGDGQNDTAHTQKERVRRSDNTENK